MSPINYTNGNGVPALPPSIIRKAAAILVSYLRGELHPRKCHHGANGAVYYAFNVGFRYRILCLDIKNSKNPNAWELTTHSIYNGRVNKR